MTLGTVLLLLPDDRNPSSTSLHPPPPPGLLLAAMIFRREPKPFIDHTHLLSLGLPSVKLWNEDPTWEPQLEYLEVAAAVQVRRREGVATRRSAARRAAPHHA